MLTKMWSNWNSSCWSGCGMVQPLWKTAWQFLEKLNVPQPYALATPLSDIYIRGKKAYVDTNTYMNIHKVVLASNASTYPATSRKDKGILGHSCNKILLSTKRKRTVDYLTGRDLRKIGWNSELKSVHIVDSYRWTLEKYRLTCSAESMSVVTWKTGAEGKIKITKRPKKTSGRDGCLYFPDEVIIVSQIHMCVYV